MLILLGGCVVTGIGWQREYKHNKQLTAIIEEDAKVIDSLVNKPRKSLNVDINLDVTDKSTYKVNAKGNQGTIQAPNDKVYELKVELDSVEFTTFEK
jgi:hypothetical protein